MTPLQTNIRITGTWVLVLLIGLAIFFSSCRTTCPKNSHAGYPTGKSHL